MLFLSILVQGPPELQAKNSWFNGKTEGMREKRSSQGRGNEEREKGRRNRMRATKISI